MQGSTVAQFLFQAYGDVATQAAKALVGPVITAVLPYLKILIAFVVLVIGKRWVTAAGTMDEMGTRLARCVVVAFLLTASAFDTYITTPLTTTIPDFITNVGSGQQNLTGAQGDDALINATENFASQVRAQAGGVLYIGERIVIWACQLSCEVIVLLGLAIRLLAKNAILFLLPVTPLLLPFFLFDATREFTMALVGYFIGLFLVMLLALMLGAFVVKQDALYLQQYAKQIAASRANDNFSMNGGGTPFTAFDPELGAGGALGNSGAADTAAGTANVSAGIGTLVRIAGVFLFGLFELGLVTWIALGIARASGFSVTPAMNAMTGGVRMAMGGAAGLAGSGSRRRA